MPPDSLLQTSRTGLLSRDGPKGRSGRVRPREQRVVQTGDGLLLLSPTIFLIIHWIRRGRKSCWIRGFESLRMRAGAARGDARRGGFDPRGHGELRAADQSSHRPHALGQSHEPGDQDLRPGAHGAAQPRRPHRRRGRGGAGDRRPLEPGAGQRGPAPDRPRPRVDGPPRSPGWWCVSRSACAPRRRTSPPSR